MFANFSVILKYNNAASYALAVALLADRMAGGEPVKHAWPRDERALSRSERISFQTDLAMLGFDPGAPDEKKSVVGRTAGRATEVTGAGGRAAGTARAVSDGDGAALASTAGV